MTIVFDDEELYTALKVEAARSHRPAKDIVAEALVMLFEASRRGQDVAAQLNRAPGDARGDESAVDEILKELVLQHRRPVEAQSN
jgi:hypothetical protein